MIFWNDLSKEEQCVLLGAAESAMLLDVLAMWRPGLDYSIDSPLMDVPRLAEAVASLLDKGLVEVYVDRNLCSPAAARAVVCDEQNWWTSDGPAMHVELAPSEAADGVPATAEDLYAYRNHD